MNPLRRLDAFHRERPFAADAIVAGLLLFFLVLIPYLLTAPAGGIFGFPGTPAWLVALDAVVDAALVGAWAFRRRAPLPAIRTAVALCLVILLIGPDFTPALVVVPMFVHHAAATFSRRGALTVLGVALAGAAACGVKNGWFSRSRTVGGISYGEEAMTIALAMAVPCAAIALAAWAFGDVARTRLIALRAVEDRARRLEVQAAQERELAAADERNRIAREMHDIVSHSLQVVISQADGARYAAAQRPELAVQTLETIAGTGRTALAEMRALLGVLRPSSPSAPAAGTAAAGSPGRSTGSGSPATGAVPASSRTEAAPRHPQPTLEDIGELVDTVRLSGLEVEVERRGSPPRPLPAGGELAAYRIVQEALTNTLRHGGPQARAHLTLEWTERGLDLTVRDDGLGASASGGTTGGGHGLQGMAERARLFGGALEAGPGPAGAGWQVRAQLPCTAE